MSATDHLHPVEFRREPEGDKKHAKRERELEAKGQDLDAAYGYSEYDQSDAQWNRKRHSDHREVF